MNKTSTTPRRAWLLASTGLALLLIAGPIRADEPHGRSHGHKHRGQHCSHTHRGHHRAPSHAHDYPRYGGRHDLAPPVVFVPTHIAHRDALRYQRYHHGTVWYAPHRHAHGVYYFPVRAEYGVVARPHYYCAGELFPDSHVAYRGNQVSFSIRF